MDIKQFKQQLLDKLFEPYIQCTQCPLGYLGRTHVVFGEGNPDARLLFIGEGPGRQEDLSGKPFMGRSGKILNEGLAAAGIKRADIYITNVVKCRPPKNRNPLPLESNTCKNLLLYNQIKIIRPTIIVTLGAVAYKALLDKKKAEITKKRGIFEQFCDTKLLPIFHPAYILRNPAKRDIFFEDIKLAAQSLK